MRVASTCGDAKFDKGFAVVLGRFPLCWRGKGGTIGVGGTGGLDTMGGLVVGFVVTSRAFVG